MPDILIRPAVPTDAAALTGIHCSHVTTWRQGGKGEAVPYESLSLYERWLHGGPWMSVETCAAHLGRWLQNGHWVLAAEQEGEVIGEAEFVENHEPAPYGQALHLSLLFVHAKAQRQGVGQALIAAGTALARQQGCAVITTQPEEPAQPFYQQVGFTPWLRMGEWQMAARETPLPVEPEPAPQAPYPTGEHLVLRSGRYQCSRQAWENLSFPLGLPEQSTLPWGRWRVALPGGPAVWLGLRAQPLDPIQADGTIWAPVEMPIRPAVETLSVLAARLGFAFVDLLLEDSEKQTLGHGLSLDFQKEITLWSKTLEVKP